MPYTDPIVLGLLIVSLIGSVAYQWRRGLRGGRLAVVAFAMFYGLSVIVALGMHNVDVLYGLAHRRESFGTGKPFGWGWHMYSLLLFGALLVWLGVLCVRHALSWAAATPTRARQVPAARRHHAAHRSPGRMDPGDLRRGRVGVERDGMLVVGLGWTRGRGPERIGWLSGWVVEWLSW